MHRALLPALAALAGAVAVACSGGGDRMRCDEPGEYVTSRSAPPVRVPDGLSVPDETGALRVPPASSAPPTEQDSAEAACLERPPDYFEDGATQGASR